MFPPSPHNSRSAPSRLALPSLLVPIFLAGLSLACQSGQSAAGASPEGQTTVLSPRKDFVFPYRLDAPDERHELPGRLREISGLAWLGKKRLACVQDEKAVVYVYDVKRRELVAEQDFGKDGDFEGIAWTGKELWVLRSDGNLWRINQFDPSREKAKDKDTRTYETFLKSANDAEGLAYDRQGKRLLVACKGHSGLEGSKSLKAIYPFDLGTRTLAETPAFTIDPAAWRAALPQPKGAEKLVAFLDPDGGRSFRPSAIAVHPKTGNHYVLSASEPGLVVLSPEGLLLYSAVIDPDLLPQPEGMAFAPDGTLYLASEARGKHAVIVAFQPR